MARYVRGPKAWWDDGADLDTKAVPALGHPTVVSGPADTGLLDADGNPIWRLPDEMGFYTKDRKPR